MAAGAFALAATQHWTAPSGYGPIVLVGLAIVAAQFPLHLAPNDRLDLSAGVYVCLVLLLSTPVAVLLAIPTHLVGAIISAALLLGRTKVKPSPFVVLFGLAFNSAQVALSVLAAGASRDLVTASMAGSPAAIFVTPAAAGAAFYVVNTMAVSTAIGFDIARNPLRLLLESTRDSGLYFALLFAAAALTYWLTLSAWWGILVVALAVLLVHRGLSRRVRKIEGIFTALQKKADEIDARDPYTANHSKRVAFYSVLIATALGIGAKDIELLRTAARVHDIGKALVPPEVLLKEGRLNDEEWELLKRHPVEGYRMLAAYSAYERGKTLVLVHHERYDGRGYPSGISLRELHLLAQIIPVADSIDAMRSDRPYRRGLSDSRVAAILMEGRGRQWNPHVVDAAITALGLDAAVNAPVAA